MEPEYAESWDIYEYEAQGAESPYRLIDVHDSALYLLVPEGAEAPPSADESVAEERPQRRLGHYYLPWVILGIARHFRR
jgi:hypothetical protein